MYVGSSILYTTDNNANKATENILDPSGGIAATKRFDGKYENMYFKFTYDARGSIISILDPDINRVKGYGYDDAGNTTEVGDFSFKNEVKYGGMIEDEASGLHYMNARHYNPTSGRFLTEDTYNDPLSPDLYTYAGNNPVNYVDPTGHNAITRVLKGIATLFVGVVTVATVSLNNTLEDSFKAVKEMCNYVKKLWSKSTVALKDNTVNKRYPSTGMTHDSGMRDAIWGIPNSGNSHNDSLINGMPLSQELDRVSEDVARIQMKAVENTPDEGVGDADDYAKAPFLPDEYYEKKLPSQVPPGTKSLPKYDEYGNLKQRKYYDEYGREKGWTDYTDHGFPNNHTVPHWHEKLYNRFFPKGKRIDHRTNTTPPF